MKKLALGIILCIILLTLSGCDQQTNFNLADQIEFLPESGASQYVMCSALDQAIHEINFEKYRNKTVYYDISGGTSYTQAVLHNLVEGSLVKVKASLLTHLTDDQKNQGQKETPGDYNLSFGIMTCGIHSYDGIVRKNIVGLAMLSLDETDKNSHIARYEGKLQSYHYKPLIFSNYFIIAILTLIVLGFGILFRRFLLFKQPR